MYVRPVPVQSVPQPTYAVLVVEVPEDATVYLSGQRMTTTGTVRKYRVPTERAGVEYTYAVRVQVERNGQQVATEHYEAVRAGRTANITIRENANAQLVAVAAR